MPEIIQLFQLFVGAPSDVGEALEIIGRLIEQWNRDHGPSARARVELTNWRTHSYPAVGTRPQAVINKQVVDHCDIMAAFFHSRFGTPTGIADSGTAEEIHRSIRNGKSVMVYFAQLPKPRRQKDRDEFLRIEKFKRRLGRVALYHSYTDLVGFEEVFRQHLARVMNELLKKHPMR